MSEHDYRPLRTTVYEDDEGEQRAFPHDYGPVYDETVHVLVREGEMAGQPGLSGVLKATKRWTRLERDPGD